MDRAWLRPVAEGNVIGLRTTALGAFVVLAVVGLIIALSYYYRSDSTDGREAFPAASRPVEVPSPGRTGSGGNLQPISCIRGPWVGDVRFVRCDRPEPSAGGVYCAGAPGLDWEWVGGGVLTYVTCDGVRVRAWAWTPAPDPAPPVPRYETAAPWVGVWPEELWPAVEAIDWCESRAGQHPDTYRLDLVHGGRMQIAHDVWAAYFEREFGWSWEMVVRDDAIHFQAAYVIYQRSGSFAPWPNCGRGW